MRGCNYVGGRVELLFVSTAAYPANQDRKLCKMPALPIREDVKGISCPWRIEDHVARMTLILKVADMKSDLLGGDPFPSIGDCTSPVSTMSGKCWGCERTLGYRISG